MMEFYDEIELPPNNKKTLRPIKGVGVFIFICIMLLKRIRLLLC